MEPNFVQAVETAALVGQNIMSTEEEVIHEKTEYPSAARIAWIDTPATPTDRM
jgi:hypothetical protein